MEIRENKQVIIDGKAIHTWDEVKSAYGKRMETYGPGSKGLFYSSDTAHSARLAHSSKILHQIIRPDDSVLDVGCGVGALVPFMPPCVYRGIDLVAQSVEEAIRFYPDLSFDCANLTDITEKYDWVFLIAITASVPMPEVLIKKAWELSTKGIIVDFLDARKDHGDDLNTFRMGACTDLFLDMGAQRIELYPTRNLWNVYVVHKEPFWL